MQRTFGAFGNNSTRRIDSLPLAIIKGRCEAPPPLTACYSTASVPGIRLHIVRELPDV
jgi:hypothetical protein